MDALEIHYAEQLVAQNERIIKRLRAIHYLIWLALVEALILYVITTVYR